jgi:SAM-dependent methyltransferase
LPLESSDIADKLSRRETPRKSARRSVLGELYPERMFAGFCRDEGRFLFYSIVADLLTPQSVVLDFGAGRGTQTQNSSGHLRRIMDFRGRCARVIGVDPDPAVLENPFLDEVHVVDSAGKLPLPDASVDVIVAFAVLEHVDNPMQVVAEVARVLKPGGWFCGWTPNKWGYIGIGARLVPNQFHAKLLSAADPRDHRKVADVFPTVYRLNTLGAIKDNFDAREFEHFSFIANGTPSYHFDRLLIARFWQIVMQVLPRPMGKTLFVFERKR